VTCLLEDGSYCSFGCWRAQLWSLWITCLVFLVWICGTVSAWPRGILTLFAMTGTLMLATRLPALQRHIPHDRAITVHRTLGTLVIVGSWSTGPPRTCRLSAERVRNRHDHCGYIWRGTRIPLDAN
jgi:hypothetical protein